MFAEEYLFAIGERVWVVDYGQKTIVFGTVNGVHIYIFRHEETLTEQKSITYNVVNGKVSFQSLEENVFATDAEAIQALEEYLNANN